MAVAVTYGDVVAIAPEFADLAEEQEGQDQITAMIEIARSVVCEDAWGTKAKNAISLMTAHLLKELGYGPGGYDSSVVGPVTSVKVGDLQRTYGAADSGMNGFSVNDKLLMSTKYGRTFAMLRKTLALTPRIV